MRGEKTVQFQDWTFTYSKNGKFAEGNSIVVREPGLGLMEVYTTMAAYVAEAIMKLAERRSGAQQKSDVPTDEPSLDETSDQEVDVLIYMRMALGAERYPQFIRYVRSVLTSKPKLAHVGGDDKAAITEEIWEDVAKNGGLAAVMEVVSAFTGFFFEELESKSPKKNGAASSTTSGSPPPAISHTSAPANSRLRKS